MSTVSISRVTVKDDGVDRTTTIVVGEGRRGNGYTCEADSLPPGVRAYLLGWLGAESATGGGGGHEAAEDAPGVGFRAPAEVTARRNLPSSNHQM